ncbi:Gfo/Idh/MocA family protein [Ideonella sp. YS5]|uniref:Gfo/Idh/MocA family protein n=1 Tax=Ideonella sp. YS5 TaxID=3453714 RepID=UPI003EED3BFD
MNGNTNKNGRTPTRWGIGIVGLGVMGWRMAQALGDHPAFRVVAACDPAPEAASRGLAMLDSAEAVVGHPEVDCVYIASPPAWHRPHVEMAAAAGKAVLCEKPLAASIEDAEGCCRALQAAGVRAGVNFPFATSHAARQMRRLVADHALGRIERADLTLRFARWPRAWQADAAGWLAAAQQGGFTREVVSHFLFLAARLFGRGEVESVALERGPAGAELKLAARLRFGGHTPLSIDAQVAGSIDDYNRFELIGEEGTAALTDWQRLDYRGHLSERVNSMPNQLEGLRRLLAGEPDHGLATPEEAAEVVRLVERILATAPVALS